MCSVEDDTPKPGTFAIQRRAEWPSNFAEVVEDGIPTVEQARARWEILVRAAADDGELYERWSSQFTVWLEAEPLEDPSGQSRRFVPPKPFYRIAV